MFKAVKPDMDFPEMERELLKDWYENGIVEKYLHKNDESPEKFSFLDGPITANNPMGVHHAWSRTYKDLWQRYWNMRGKKERFQNGFDEQGLWVEVEVEKELDLHTKKDIENLVPGDKVASIAKFVNLCKDRVKKFSGIQTEQSKRLGYFMDWDNSYHTSSDINNYTIWHFLKVVNEKGWLYKGHDSVPWCPRCGTAISQHEILTEDYKEVDHESIYFKLPIKGRENEYLLVWTTTPWTIPANVAVAVNKDEEYTQYPINDGQEFVWVMSKAAKRLVEKNILPPTEAKILDTKPGAMLEDTEYLAPFDHLPRVDAALGEYVHRVILTDPMILPVTEEEGTGLVHIAPGAGSEDFKLGAKLGIPVIEVIDEEANYMDGMEEYSGQNAKKHPELIIDFLKEKDGGKFLLKTERIKHRYPICWRCKTELVWRVVDEWYIAMDREDSSGRTYREQMIEVNREINWLPKWGKDRELDWLNNMHDWLISKKRYWGLALPIWECKSCGEFNVIGSKDELREKAVEGWEDFEGNSPHRPWVDQIKIKCEKCGEEVSRIADVGNPWLDAGIVPFSTMPEDWYPADFITESFPGQFKNWFYSLIAMATALKNEPSFKTVLGFASAVDEKGEPMHKSKGNSIEFNEAADQMGADIMRWMYVTQNPENNLLFGFNVAAEVKRRFYLILWNSYKFFVDYANSSDWHCELEHGELSVLDKWVLARLTEVVLKVNSSLEKYDASTASKAIEDFVVNDLSTWYIRRSRDRVGSDAEESEKNTVLSVLYGNLVTLSKLLAPFLPFISEEIYGNLTSEASVHLVDYPLGDKSLLDEELIKDMKIVREIVEMGHSKRKEAEIKLRQPLSKIMYSYNRQLSQGLEKIIAEELNVKEVVYGKPATPETEAVGLSVTLDTGLTPELKDEGWARDFMRNVQIKRKEENFNLNDKSIIYAPEWPEKFESMILDGTASTKIVKSEEFKIEKV